MEKEQKKKEPKWLFDISFVLMLINDLIIKMESEYNPVKNHTF